MASTNFPLPAADYQQYNETTQHLHLPCASTFSQTTQTQIPHSHHGERERRDCRSVSLNNRPGTVVYLCTPVVHSSHTQSSALSRAQNTNIRLSYVPRKCSATNRIIKAKDHASVQISVGKVDENGRYTGENQTYALCGFVRSRAESDDSFNRLAQRDGFLKAVWSAQQTR